LQTALGAFASRRELDALLRIQHLYRIRNLLALLKMQQSAVTSNQRFQNHPPTELSNSLTAKLVLMFLRQSLELLNPQKQLSRQEIPEG
jgi:hypothetical protein